MQKPIQIPPEQIAKERWTHVIGYKGLYEVSTASRVRSNITGKMLTPIFDQGMYMKVMLYKNGTRINHRVHILVAKAWKRNPKKKAEVNHKDKVRWHNWSDNLEWSTRSENMIHCYKLKNK